MSNGLPKNLLILAATVEAGEQHAAKLGMKHFTVVCPDMPLRPLPVVDGLLIDRSVANYGAFPEDWYSHLRDACLYLPSQNANAARLQLQFVCGLRKQNIRSFVWWASKRNQNGRRASGVGKPTSLAS